MMLFASLDPASTLLYPRNGITFCRPSIFLQPYSIHAQLTLLRLAPTPSRTSVCPISVNESTEDLGYASPTILP